MSACLICNGTKPSRNASTSAAVISCVPPGDGAGSGASFLGSVSVGDWPMTATKRHKRHKIVLVKGVLVLGDLLNMAKSKSASVRVQSCRREFLRCPHRYTCVESNLQSGQTFVSDG